MKQKHEQNIDHNSCTLRAQAMVVRILTCMGTCSRAEVFMAAYT